MKARQFFTEPVAELPPPKAEPESEYTPLEQFIGGFKRQNDALALQRIMDAENDWTYDPAYAFEEDEENKN